MKKGRFTQTPIKDSSGNPRNLLHQMEEDGDVGMSEDEEIEKDDTDDSSVPTSSLASLRLPSTLPHIRNRKSLQSSLLSSQ